MREIKFRAWDVFRKRISLVKCLEYISGGINVSVNPYVDPDAETATFVDENEVLDDCILMQFTGLLDKNGKEIYEGDVVTAPYRKGPQLIFFGVGGEGEPADTVGAYTGWCIGDEECTGFTQYETGQYEVIGNIYENPELLGGKP